MTTVNKINNNATQAVQRYMEIRMTANGVGAITGSNASNMTGSMTDNPFPTVYYYEGVTGFICGAENHKPTKKRGVIFPEKVFHVDPSLINPSTLSFQSERMQNVGQYERNLIAIPTDNSSMEGDA